ncbi:MAG: endonuclease/exonuclease/phosphatase family protein [Propionicimonas sp.]|uniref:endonuclease/exonuclease/phosphatase family protein n=1 Tax=Propionicimonas sp. TaxID=1955623 RepID=UPI003D0D4364
MPTTRRNQRSSRSRPVAGRAPAHTSGTARPGPRGSATPPRSIRWLLGCVMGFGFVGLALLILVVAPQLQALHMVLAMAASFAPYGAAAWLLSLVLALVAARGRTRLVAAPLALGLALHTGVLAAYLPSAETPPVAGSTPVSVLALNLRFGLADLDELREDVERSTPDVVVLTEVTRSDAKTLSRTAWTRLLPYQAGTAGTDYQASTGTGDARGTMVLSRYPLSHRDDATGTRFTDFSIRVALPDAPFTLLAAHPANPTHGLESWLGDADAVTALALRHQGGPLVVAGDLNATAEHLTLRELTAKAGLRSMTGGWNPTYPADEWYPPLLQIDHVLASEQVTPTGFRTVRVAGTDHLGLLVDLSIAP